MNEPEEPNDVWEEDAEHLVDTIEHQQSQLDGLREDLFEIVAGLQVLLEQLESVLEALS